MKHRISPANLRKKGVLCAAGFILVPIAAHAYVGPGAGLTAIGTMIALVAAVVLAVIGFVWYPLKRMLRRGGTTDTISREPGTGRDPGA